MVVTELPRDECKGKRSLLVAVFFYEFFRGVREDCLVIDTDEIPELPGSFFNP